MDKNESGPIRKRGGQPGNQNARKHGFYTADGRKRIQDMDGLIRDCEAFVKAIEEEDYRELHRMVSAGFPGDVKRDGSKE